MELYQCISAAEVILGMKAQDRWEALKELLERIYPSRGDERLTVLRNLYAAEGHGCTAIGRSVIVAHAVTGSVRGLRVVFGRSAHSIPWNAPDGLTVNLLWLLIHSPNEQDDYLEVLAQIVRLCRCTRHREELLAATIPAEVLGVISCAGCAHPEDSGTHHR